MGYEKNELSFDIKISKSLKKKKSLKSDQAPLILQVLFGEFMTKIFGYIIFEIQDIYYYFQ